MKKKLVLLNWALTVAVLFSILFQSVDSYGHLATQRTEKQCHHKHNSNAEITHQHHKFDHCFVCEFTFSSFISPETFAFQTQIIHQEKPFLLSVNKVFVPFFGSSHSLRGPPNCIV
jgi:hypothetical protein